jgi:hypothetical protein
MASSCKSKHGPRRTLLFATAVAAASLALNMARGQCQMWALDPQFNNQHVGGNYIKAMQCSTTALGPSSG